MFLYPLQISYIQESDPKLAIIVIIIFLAGITALIIKNVLSAKRVIKNTDSNAFSGFTAAAGGGPRSVRRIAARYGLNAAQSDFLYRHLRKTKNPDTEALAANPSAFDAFLKQSYNQIEHSAENDKTAEEEKALLFSIRAALDDYEERGTKTPSSVAIVKKSGAGVLIGPKNEHYPVRILQSQGDRVLIETPRDVMGNLIRFPRGAELSLSVMTEAAQSVIIYAKILSYTKAGKDLITELELAPLSDRQTKRRGRRRSSRFSCVFVHYVPNSKTPPGTGSAGLIIDVSAGGCAIKTAAPLKAGVFARVDMDDSHGNKLPFIGRVVRTNRSGNATIMHIQFAKIPTNSLNTIYSQLFGYRQD